jgi:hypothetical protein
MDDADGDEYKPWTRTVQSNPTFKAAANGLSLYLPQDFEDENQHRQVMVQIGRVLERLSIPNEGVTYVTHDDFNGYWFEVVFATTDDALAFRLASSLPFQTEVS